MKPACRDDATLDDFVEAYESAQAAGGSASLSDFLPAPGHALYSQVLRELVRVDLEYSWQRGKPERIDHYQSAYPLLAREPDALRAISFEEYRLRLQAGESVTPAEYSQRYGIDTSDWPAPASAATPAPAVDELSQVAFGYRDVCRRADGNRDQEMAAWMKSLPPDSGPAQLFRDLYESAPAAASRLADAVTSLPQVGAEFIKFKLVAELGRGAFGKVFLARQPDLANRYVALKVTTCLFEESQTLAQLQHPHIVPVHSVHQAPPFQAVCMPYSGAITLADVLRELQAASNLPASGRFFLAVITRKKSAASNPKHSEFNGPLASRSYADACLWIAARLAEGLAHAHARGILHRDLKPANVLLTDDGQPMLLDFNLADDIKVRSPVAAAIIGGTLPYMAPEQLRAHQIGEPRADARSDIYSLGLLLYELLTGKYPYPLRRGPVPLVVTQMLADRRQPLPAADAINRSVSPAAAAIVRNCLAADVADRYQSAQALADDLDRHLGNLPLRHTAEPSRVERARKWVRRHPRWAAATAVGAVLGLALVIACGLFIARGQRLERLDALEAFQSFSDDIRRAHYYFFSAHPGDTEKLNEGRRACRRILDRYHVPDNAHWFNAPIVQRLPVEQQAWLRLEMGEILLLWSRLNAPTINGVGNRDPSVLQESLRLNRMAENCFQGGPTPRVLWAHRAEIYRLLGDQDAEADARAEAEAPGTPIPRDLVWQAAEKMMQRRFGEARELLQQAAQLEPQNLRIWIDTGFCCEHLGRHADAATCFSICIALWPQFAPLYFERGKAHLHAGDFAAARADFDTALKMQSEDTEALTPAVHCEVYLERALAYLELKNTTAALADLTRVTELPNHPTRVYFMRAQVRERTRDIAGAKQDRRTGLRLEPTDARSWVARGYARMTADPKGALADFDQALALNPTSAEALEKKAHVLAERLQRPDDALQVLDRQIELYPEAVLALGGRGVLLARRGRYADARRDAEDCLRLDSSARTKYQVAGIYALTSQQTPDDRAPALRLLEEGLREGFGWEYVATDSDLDPLRKLPEFDAAVARAKAARQRK